MNKNKVEWIPLYPAEFLADLLLMTPEAGGAYCRLCFTLYNEGGTLPNDNSHLAMVCGFDDITFKQKIWPQIERKFIKKNGEISQKRCTKELKKARHIMQVRRRAGLTASEKRWNKDNKRITNAQQTNTHLTLDNIHKTIDNKEEKKKDRDGLFNQISAACLIQGLPETEAKKICDFICRKKIKTVYSPVAFVAAWRLNPKRREIELADAVREKERSLAGEKRILTEATHKLLVKYGIEPPKLKKDATKPMTDAEKEQRRQMFQKQLAGK